MPKALLEKWARKADRIPMPFGGRVLLTLYWWAWKIFGPGRDWSNYDEVTTAVNTPLKAQAFLWANIKYKTDKNKEDYWQPARVTFERMAGDCEDWAIFANRCLRAKYDCLFLCMYTKDDGHCTLLIEKGKSGKKQKWTSVGTFGYHHHKGRDYGDIIPDWNGYKKWVKYTVKDEKITTIVKKEREG